MRSRFTGTKPILQIGFFGGRVLTQLYEAPSVLDINKSTVILTSSNVCTLLRPPTADIFHIFNHAQGFKAKENFIPVVGKVNFNTHLLVHISGDIACALRERGAK